MRLIKVTGWDSVLTEGELDSSVMPLRHLTEGALYSIEISQVSCSIDLIEEESVLLQTKEDFIYGDAVSLLDKAIELALANMCDRETAAVEIDLMCKYISSRFLLPEVHISFNVTLIIKEDGIEIPDLTDGKKIELANKYKDFGTNALKDIPSVDIGLAISTVAFLCFARAIKWCVMIEYAQLDDEQKNMLNILKNQCYNNISQHHIRVKQYNLGIVAATHVLDKEPTNVKAMYRRAVGLTHIQEYDDAKRDLHNALLVDPSNKTLRKQLDLVISKIKSCDEKYANAMKKYFS